MYEWPNSIHSNQDYPLLSLFSRALSGTPNWSSQLPIPANKLAAKLRLWWDQELLGNGKISFEKVAAPDIQSYVRAFTLHAEQRAIRTPIVKAAPPPFHLSKKHYRNKFTPDYIILAAGMGAENVTLPGGVKGTPFWALDQLKKKATANQKIGVFGGGDGAMQDVLRLITKFKHPLEIISFLEKNLYVKNALAKHLPVLENLEQQSRQIATWSSRESYELIDQQCNDIASTLAKDRKIALRVVQCLRSGTGCVHHFIKERNFGKAYLLNRFCIYLILHSLAYPYKNRSNMDYRLHWDSSIIFSKKNLTTITVTFANKYHNYKNSFDLVVVRFGIEEKTIPAHQMVTLNQMNKSDRISMAGIPLPFVVSSNI
jgi:hypothetical protein